MPKQAEIKAKLSLNTSPFQQGLKGAKNAAAAFGRSIATVAKSTAATAAGFGAVGLTAAYFFGNGIKSALDLGGSLADLSAQTGETSGNLMLMKQVLADNGVEAEQAGAILNKLEKKIADANDGSTEARKSFRTLGLTFQDLKGKSPVEQFKTVGKAVSSIVDPAERAQAAMELFGKSGGKLLGALGDGSGFEKAAASIGRQADILSKNQAIFDDVSDRLGRASLKAQGFFVGAASELAPLLDKITDKLDGMDLAGQGERFGAGVKDGARYMAGFAAMAKSSADYVAQITSGLTGKFDFLMKGLAVTPGLSWLGKSIQDATTFFGVLNDNMGQMGDQFLDTMTKAEEKAKNIAKPIKQPFVSASSLNTSTPGLMSGSLSKSQFSFLQSMSHGGNAEGLAASSLSKATGHHLFGWRERRDAEDAVVAAGGARHANSVEGYNSIRSGDARRRKEAAKKAAKDEKGVELSNKILEQIKTATTDTMKELKSWSA